MIMMCMLVIMCVTPPILVGAWLMAGDEGVGLLKVEVKLGSCSSTVFEREAVKLADSPQSPRLVHQELMKEGASNSEL